HEDGRCVPSALQEFVGQPVSGFETVVPFEDERWVHCYVRLAESFLVALQAFARIQELEGARDDGDATMSQLQKMAHAFASSPGIIEEDCVPFYTSHRAVEEHHG